MKLDVWAKQLRRFKEQEKPETVLIVAGSSDLTRMVVAWMGIKVNRKKKLPACEGNDDDAIWRWLWRCTLVPEDWFYGRIPGCREKAEQNFAVLVANHVLYPDGSVNGFVERYLREKVLSLFGMVRTKTPAA